MLLMQNDLLNVLATIYRSRTYAEYNIAKQYISVDVYGQVHLYDVNHDGKTIQQLIVNACIIPEDKLQYALSLKGKSFNQVEL